MSKNISRAAVAAQIIREIADSMPPGPARDQVGRKLAELCTALEEFPAVAASGCHDTPADSKRTIEQALRPVREALTMLEIMMTAHVAAAAEEEDQP